MGIITKRRLGCCLLGLLTALSANAAGRADEAEDLFTSLYGKRLEAVAATRESDDDLQLARSLLADAKDEKLHPRVVELLCRKACELAVTDRDGVAVGIMAIETLGKRLPETRPQCLEKLLELHRLAFRRADRAGKTAAGVKLIQAARALSNHKLAAEDYTEAIAICSLAVRVGRTVRWPGTDALAERYKALLGAREAHAKAEQARETLASDPANAEAKNTLLRYCIVERNAPEQATRYLGPGAEPRFATYVPMLTRPLKTLDPRACMELGDWCRQLASEASPLGAPGLLKRARACYQRFLTAADTDGVAATKARLALKQVEERLTQYVDAQDVDPLTGMTGPDLAIRGGDPGRTGQARSADVLTEPKKTRTVQLPDALQYALPLATGKSIYVCGRGLCKVDPAAEGDKAVTEIKVPALASGSSYRPFVYADGKLLTFDRRTAPSGNREYVLQALDIETGEAAWSHPVGENVYRQDPLLLEGTVYLAVGSELLALDLDSGKVKFRVSSPKPNTAQNWKPSIVAGEGKVFAQCGTGLYAIHCATGEVAWGRVVGGSSSTRTMALAYDSGVVYAMRYGKVHAYEARSGREGWAKPEHLYRHGHSARVEGLAVANGKVFLASRIDSKPCVVALNVRTGATAWGLEVPEGTPLDLVVTDRALYFLTRSERAFLYAVSTETGKVLWKRSADINTESGSYAEYSRWGPMLVAGHIVYKNGRLLHIAR